MRLSAAVVLDKLRRKFPLTCYLSILTLVTLTAGLLFLGWAESQGAHWVALLLLAVPTLLAASSLGLAIVNWLATQVLRPQSLPRMDFEPGIPPEHRTLVVVPTMLTSPAGIEHLLDGLEVRYLANRDPCLHFALLTDFVDAPAETLPSDAELVRLAREGIERLNEKYADRSRRHLLSSSIAPPLERPGRRVDGLRAQTWQTRRSECHAARSDGPVCGSRRRSGDPAAACATSSRSIPTRSCRATPPHRWWARSPIRSIGRSSMHSAGRVVDGYTILQPRVGVSLPSAQRSRFVQLYAGDPGVDPYTRVVSDVYQDLFGEGSFIGKGIYDVDSFERCCSDFPDNAILSHDLIEGAYCRSALLSDVTLYEEYPSRYIGDIARRHRWMRGDWQIAGWLLPWVRGRSGNRVRNPISRLSRWKIFDNLRRSAVPWRCCWCWSSRGSSRRQSRPELFAFWRVVLLLPLVFDTLRDLLSASRWICRWGCICRATLPGLRRPLVRSCLTSSFCRTKPISAPMRSCGRWYRMLWTQAAAAGMEDGEQRFGTRRRGQSGRNLSGHGGRAGDRRRSTGGGGG